jgi:CRP-like cAMP-binding protein
VSVDSADRLSQLEAEIEREPRSIAKRLDLAAALAQANRSAEAVELYRKVAERYALDGQLVQAIAVCKGILELDPVHVQTLELLSSLARRRAGAESLVGRAAARWADETLRATDLSATSLEDFVDEEDTQAGTLYAAEGAALTDAGDESVAATHDDLEEPTQIDRQPRGWDRSAEPELGFDDAAESAERSSTLPRFPLFSDLSTEAFVELVRRMERVRLGAGLTILSEGAPGDAFYLLASGSVRVVKAGIELAVLPAGSFFGEFAVLSDQRRHASVESVTEVDLLEVRRSLLDELAASHPSVARTIRRFYSERLLSTLLATAPFFDRLTVKERVEIAARLRPRRFGRGAAIIEEGQPGGGLYLIMVGEVEVVRREGGVERPIGTLTDGSYFGEMSLLKGGVASATVRATRLTETVQLPPRDFREMAAHHPVLWDQVRAEAERRELANHAILAGVARGSSDGSIYLV